MKLKRLKNKILYSIFVLRSVPKHYFFTICKTKEDKRRTKHILFDLKKLKYLTIHTTLEGLGICYLAKKGYEYVVEKLLETDSPQYVYGTKKSRAFWGNHPFMNFKFVWHFISKNPDITEKDARIFTDTDLRNCKLKVEFSGEEVPVMPDVLISIPLQKPYRKVILVENDNSKERQLKIYQKLLKYSLLFRYGLSRNFIKEVDFYFIALTDKRIQRVFYQEDGVAKYFDNNNFFGRTNDIRIKEVVQGLGKPNVNYYLSPIDPLRPKKFNILDTLYLKQKSWEVFLKS